MKRKNLSAWIKEKGCSRNESGIIRNDSVQIRKYGYDDLRDYPFGIMERCEDLSDEDVARIRKKIRELDGGDCGGDDEGK